MCHVLPMKTLCGVLAWLLCLGCASGRRVWVSPTSGGALSEDDSARIVDPPSSAVRNDIMEVVFRDVCQPQHIWEDVSHQGNLVHKVYFLAIGGLAIEQSTD